MSDMQARLVVQRGPNPGTTFILEQDQITIGRSDSNGIVLADPEISRQHAQLILQEGRYAVQDLGSTNGSFVNSQRVTGLVPLYHGDVVSFGETITLIYWEEEVTDSQFAPVTVIEEQAPETAVPPPSPARTSEPVIQHVSIPLGQPESSPELPPLTIEEYAHAVTKRRRNWLIGCGAALLLSVCLCLAALFFLDGYQQGRLLYCGVLRPFWELILGPFGFNPACL